MNQRKILHTKQNAIPNGEGLTALPVSINFGSTVYNGKNTASIPPKTEEP
jgi:hypothetical protein